MDFFTQVSNLILQSTFRRRSLKLHSVSGKIALPTQRKKPNTMFLFVPVDRHCFPITFTAATVVQGSP